MEILSKVVDFKFSSQEIKYTVANSTDITVNTQAKDVIRQGKLREFMTRIRMEKARELLESGKYRIQEIPEMVGLKDVKNFRNKYKKHFGIAPSETLRNI